VDYGDEVWADGSAMLPIKRQVEVQISQLHMESSVGGSPGVSAATGRSDDGRERNVGDVGREMGGENKDP